VSRTWRIRVLLSALLLSAAAIAQPAQAAAAFHTKFPKDFLWGVATSGFQSEGGFPDSNWTRYAASHAGGAQTYGKSVDFLHQYPGDIQRAKAMGLKVFRTSVEWARVEPAKGKRDPRALAYYDDLVKRIRAAGMRPMLTLDHWVYPGWVADQGAWDNPQTIKDWLAEARFVVNRYKGENVMWITFNEPSAYLLEEFEHRTMTLTQVLAMRNALISAHRQAYAMIHQIDPKAMVTSNIAYGAVLNPIFDTAVFNEITDAIDFVGVDYYYGTSVTNLTVYNQLLGTPWNITPEPDGLYYVLKSYQRRFPKLPLYVVENGMVTDDGQPRADGYTRSQHLRDHVYWIQRALGDGVKVIGYNYWSITDNYEWGSYAPRFGLYTVNTSDPALIRHPTDAVATYKQIVADRGVPKGYTPVLEPAFCSTEDPIATCLGSTPVYPAP
jgi:beta-glucosidase